MIVSYEDFRSHIGHDLRCLSREDSNGVEDGVIIRCDSCNTKVCEYDSREMDCVEWSVWMLTIHTGYGMDQYIMQDETTARKQLYKHVSKFWPSEFPNESMPLDESEAIYEYFRDNEEESYCLTQQPVMCVITNND